MPYPANKRIVTMDLVAPDLLCTYPSEGGDQYPLPFRRVFLGIEIVKVIASVHRVHAPPKFTTKKYYNNNTTPKKTHSTTTTTPLLLPVGRFVSPPPPNIYTHTRAFGKQLRDQVDIFLKCFLLLFNTGHVNFLIRISCQTPY